MTDLSEIIKELEEAHAKSAALAICIAALKQEKD